MMKRRRQMIMEAHGGVLRKRRFAIIHFYPSMYKIYVQTRLNGQNLKTTRHGGFHRLQLPLGATIYHNMGT
jgi:hypothetical protein